MAETITIAGRKFPKTGVYVAGAATAGVVGWAWWTRAREDAGLAAAQKEIDDSLPGPVAEPTDTPGFDVVGGIAVKTNAEWTREAVLWLQNNGIDATAASAAIGKFMARQTLTPAEASLVEQAVASTGPPPEGGPWPIIRATVPGPVTPTTLPAPTGLRAILLRWNGNTPIYRITWNAVSGAKDYHVRHVGGSSGFQASTSFDNAGSAPGKTDKWEVAARGVDNLIGPYAPLSFVAATKTGTAPTTSGVPGAIASFGLIAGAPNKFGLSFKAAPGATSYRYRWIIDGRGGPWAVARSTTFTVTWKVVRGRKVQAEVFGVNAKGNGPAKRSNVVTSH